MQTIKISLEEKSTKEVEIPVPCFLVSKDEKDWIALIDEKTIVKMHSYNNYTNISNTEVWVNKDALAKAWTTFHSCTETQFLEKYDAIIESISLHPKLAV